MRRLRVTDRASTPPAGHDRRGRARATLARVAAHDATRRFHVVLVLAALVGAATGLIVAAFDRVVRDELFVHLLDQPLWVAAVAPAVGLALAVVCIRTIGNGDAATADAYVRSYHQRGGELRLRDLPAKALACVATLGSGAALGYEGPAILFGASVGSSAERRLARRYPLDDAKVLMVAGAAAGVAAVFKAPLTGVVFALEVPYHQDVTRRALLPALVAAGSSYLVFVALLGTEPVLSFGGSAPFDLRDLLGGLAVGVLCGVMARLGAVAVRAAKSSPVPIRVRLPIAGVVLAGLAVATDHWYDAPLSLGSGYSAIDWAVRHEDAFGLLVALFALRFLATWVSLAGGGVGGLFIPLVTQGALLGAAVQAVVDAKNPGLLPIVGIAAFLGGGYRTPLAGVAFVAEATGQPGFVVPALLASAAAQLTMGSWSFSPYQRPQRQPELVPTSRLLVREVMSPNPDVIGAATPLDEAARRLMQAHRRWAPVVDATGYAGLLSVADIAHLAPDDWPNLRAIDAARRDVRAVGEDDDVASAAAAIRDADAGAVAVLDPDGRVVGVITVRDIANVERLLDRLGDEAPGH